LFFAQLEGAKVALYFHITKKFRAKDDLVSWYRVVAGAAPGVTAQDTLDGKPESLERTVLHDGLTGIFGTGGGETAGRGCERGDELAIEQDGQ
jgi:hypothetical protein